MGTDNLPPKMLEPHRRSREEAAKAEIGHTDTRPGVALVLTVCFLVMIFALPVGQQLVEFFHGQLGNRPSSMPQAWHVATIVGDAVSELRKNRQALRQVLAVNRDVMRKIKLYTDRLEEESWFNQRALPLTQAMLSNVLGVGNEKVYLGRGDWLFYRPTIDYLIGDGFLEPTQYTRQANSQDADKRSRQSDPVKAIVQFKNQLAAHGVELVVMPVPVKASLHGDRFVKALAQDRQVLHNASYEELLQALSATAFAISIPLRIWRRSRGSTRRRRTLLPTPIGCLQQWRASPALWPPNCNHSCRLLRTPQRFAAKPRRCKTAAISPECSSCLMAPAGPRRRVWRFIRFGPRPAARRQSSIRVARCYCSVTASQTSTHWHPWVGARQRVWASIWRWHLIGRWMRCAAMTLGPMPRGRCWRTKWRAAAADWRARRWSSGSLPRVSWLTATGRCSTSTQVR
ncbi:MAG: hypothetical protein FJ145_20225 [Deltaproteobacteria bacterium]|nr:hypothetical protein [Deltaproteobacteria bacterium]